MKRKLLYFLFISLILLSPIILFFSNPGDAQAATCTIPGGAISVARSTPADNTDKVIRLSIDTVGIVDGEKLMLGLKTPDKNRYTFLGISSLGFVPDILEASNNKVITEIGRSYDGDMSKSKALSQTTFPAGDYDLIIIRASTNLNIDNPLCITEKAFKIIGSSAGNDNYCNIEFISPVGGYTSDDNVKFKVNFIAKDDESTRPSDDYKHRVIVKNVLGNIVNPIDQYSTNELITTGVTLNRLSDGDYTVEVRERASNFAYNDGRLCPGNFTIGVDGGPGCVENKQCRNLPNGDSLLCLTNPETGRLICRLPQEGEGSNPCKPDSEGNPPFKCQTAIGEISTSPGGFLKNILVLVLSLSGGIIILIIIMNGYKLMISQGDPEKVKEARESVVSAIAGLLLIIFSIAILQFITVEVLSLPGFGP